MGEGETSNGDGGMLHQTPLHRNTIEMPDSRRSSVDVVEQISKDNEVGDNNKK